MFLAARGFFERSDAVQDGSAPGSLAAIVLLDLAVETAAKAALAALAPPAKLAKWDPTLPQVIGDLKVWNDTQTKVDPDFNSIMNRATRLHEQRNAAQHASVVPSPAELNRSRIRADEALEALAMIVLGQGFRQLSRALLIREPRVSKYVRDAEQCAGRDEYVDAVGCLAAGLEVARMLRRSEDPQGWTSRLGPGEIGRAVSPLFPRKGGGSLKRKVGRDALGRAVLDAVAGELYPAGRQNPKSDLEALLGKITADLRRLGDQTEALFLGGDPVEYAWFARLTPRPIVWYSGDGIQVETGTSQAAISATDYTRASDFVTSTILRLEQIPPISFDAYPEDDGLDPEAADTLGPT